VSARPLTLLAALALLIPSTASAANIRGTKVADRIDVVGRGIDKVTCGAGIDVVTADPADRVARDCEVVSRRISTDTLTSAGGQHQTEVEPSAFGFGSSVVAAFQVGRYVDGGADGIGWASSADAGRTWRSGILPGLTIFSPSPGAAPRASDPAVAYDATRGVWLVASLVLSPAFTELAVSRSTDAVSWAPPVAAARAGPGSLAYDKEWIGCDNSAASPFRGSCYLVYTDFPARRLTIQVSRDGGQTWGPGATASADAAADVVGALPLVQPNGALTVVFLANDNGVYAVRSVDGGVSFAPRVGIAPLNAHNIRALRAPPLPSATVDASGRMYLAWTDCSFRAGCGANDIVLSSSADGVAWTQPARVPGTGAESFVPGIAADPDVPGRLALVTYVLTADGRIGVATTSSRNGGTTWTKPQRLDAVSPSPTWLADTDSGRFAGDYVGATFAAGRFVPVFALAQPPLGGRLREYMMAISLP